MGTLMDRRREAVEQARKASVVGIILGSLGRQGNPRILQRVTTLVEAKGLNTIHVVMSEVDDAKLSRIGADVWVQVSCPRLSTDWGHHFTKPLLNPFEAFVAWDDK